MKAADFISRLGAKGKPRKTATGWQACCPAHDDKSPSLSVSDGHSGVLIHCHSGCSIDSVLSAVGISKRDLMNGETKGSGKQPVATYRYRDENGVELYRVERYFPKDFRPYLPGATSPGIEGARRVLYRLPEIIQAVKRGLPVFICEGEKDVDTLTGLGLAATCNLGGAGKWRSEYNDFLRGAAVFIVSDKDEPGRKHALNVETALAGIASSVAVVELPDFNGKPVKDASDFIAAGATVADLQAELDRATATPSDTKPQDIGERLALVRFNLATPPPLETAVWRLNGGPVTHTLGNISTITAQAKAGKTALVSALAAAAITEQPDCDTFGFTASNPERLPILILDSEHSEADHWQLCDRILRRSKLTESPLLHSYRLTGFGVRDINAALAWLLNERKWLAVVIDGSGDFVADVNDPEECNAWVADLHGKAITHQTHILNVLHLNPSSEFKSRGHLGSQLERKCATNLRVEKIEGVSVVCSERNRGADIPKSTGPRFTWSDEHRMHVSAASITTAKTTAKIQAVREQIAEAYTNSGKQAGTWTEVVGWLRNVPGIKSQRTAERVFSEAKRCGVIALNIVKKWEQAA